MLGKHMKFLTLLAKPLGANLKIYEYTTVYSYRHILLMRENLQSIFLPLITMDHAVLKQYICDPPVILQC